jgi:hypothetical protein
LAADRLERDPVKPAQPSASAEACPATVIFPHPATGCFVPEQMIPFRSDSYRSPVNK